MAFISAELKSEELAASDHHFMPGRCLSETPKKITFLSLLLRECWKSVLTGNRNSRVSNETVFITEQLKGEWHNSRSSSVPRVQEAGSSQDRPWLHVRHAVRTWQCRSTSTCSTACPPGRPSGWRARAIQDKIFHSSFCLNQGRWQSAQL